MSTLPDLSGRSPEHPSGVPLIPARFRNQGGDQVLLAVRRGISRDAIFSRLFGCAPPRLPSFPTWPLFAAVLRGLTFHPKACKASLRTLPAQSDGATTPDNRSDIQKKRFPQAHPVSH